MCFPLAEDLNFSSPGKSDPEQLEKLEFFKSETPLLRIATNVSQSGVRKMFRLLSFAIPASLASYRSGFARRLP